MVKLQRFIDRFAGFFIVAFLFLFRLFDRKPAQHKKFLLIKLWAIGDSILSLSIVRGIRENFPDASVDILTRDRVMQLFTSYPFDHVLNFDATSDRKKLMHSVRSYDVVFDGEAYLNIGAILAFILGKERIGFSGQWRSCLYTKTVRFRKDQHMLENYLDMLRTLGVESNADHLAERTISDADRKITDAFLLAKKTRKLLVGITPGVAETAKNRMWYEERFSEVADRFIRELNADVMFIDSRANNEIVQKIVHGMREIPIISENSFSLKQVFSLIGNCDAYLSNDTGPMHIAACMGVKTVGLFGPNTPVLWAPYGKGNISLYKTTLPPAIENDKGKFREGNRDGYMGPITSEEVFDAVRKCLGK